MGQDYFGCVGVPIPPLGVLSGFRITLGSIPILPEVSLQTLRELPQPRSLVCSRDASHPPTPRLPIIYDMKTTTVAPPMALVAYVAENGLDGHRGGGERPLGLKVFDATI